MRVKTRKVKPEYDETDMQEAPEFLSPRIAIIAQIAAERKRQKITQRDLADRTGLKQSNISRLETGKSNPSLDFLAKVAAGLGKELQIRLK